MKLFCQVHLIQNKCDYPAYGTKEHFKSKDIDIKYYVVIPDNINSKEVKNALKEKKKLQNPEYHSSIDDIITITELIKMIDN